jgi:hypothetical protein
MSVTKRDSETVLVLLKPASGQKITATNAISDRVAELAPSPRTAARVAQYFVDRGCETGPLVGVSFALTVPSGDVASLLGDEVNGEFVNPRIPRAISRSIEAIVRDRPIDFGPVSFS